MIHVIKRLRFLYKIFVILQKWKTFRRKSRDFFQNFAVWMSSFKEIEGTVMLVLPSNVCFRGFQPGCDLFVYHDVLYHFRNLRARLAP